MWKNYRKMDILLLFIDKTTIKGLPSHVVLRKLFRQALIFQQMIVQQHMYQIILCAFGFMHPPVNIFRRKQWQLALQILIFLLEKLHYFNSMSTIVFTCQIPMMNWNVMFLYIVQASVFSSQTLMRKQQMKLFLLLEWQIMHRIVWKFIGYF